MASSYRPASCAEIPAVNRRRASPTSCAFGGGSSLHALPPTPTVATSTVANHRRRARLRRIAVLAEALEDAIQDEPYRSWAGRACPGLSPMQSSRRMGAQSSASGPSRTDAELAALAALGEGHSLGRYELLTPIGRGGMGIVW